MAFRARKGFGTFEKRVPCLMNVNTPQDLLRGWGQYHSPYMRCMMNVALSQTLCMRQLLRFCILYCPLKKTDVELIAWWEMSSALTDAFWLCFVSLLWGATNPLIRRGSKGIEEINRSSRIQQFCAEVLFLASNWKYMVPFLLNQCGSVVFYMTLASTDLTIAVPITNSLTMIVTTLVGRILGEGNINTGAFLGMVLVICGVTICVEG